LQRIASRTDVPAANESAISEEIVVAGYAKVVGYAAMNKLAELKAWAAKLEQTIVDKDARDYFLKLPKFWLEDAERKIAPNAEFLLLVIEKELQRAQDAVSKYGPNLRIVG